LILLKPLNYREYMQRRILKIYSIQNNVREQTQVRCIDMDSQVLSTVLTKLECQIYSIFVIINSQKIVWENQWIIQY